MKEFIKVLRTKGSYEIGWDVPQEIQLVCNITEKHKNFETHQELDKCMKEVNEFMPNFFEKFREDYLLLKSFDRAFWLKHFKDQKKDKFQPLKHFETGKCDCSFGNPEETMSLVKDWW